MATKQGVAPKPVKPDQWSIRTPGDWIVHDMMQSALWDYDKKIVEIEQVWGVDRLPYIVSDATRQRWWKAVEALKLAIHEGKADRVRSLVDNLIAGLDKLADEAWNLGARPLEPDQWETQMPDGRTLRLVRTWPERAYRQEKDDKAITYTLEEVARLVASLPLLNAVKKEWPEAEVTKVRSKLSEELNDEIPF